MTYRERREARADRLEQWADKRESRSEADYQAMRQIADMIPLGQPILVGHHSEGRHRRDLQRIDDKMRASVENGRTADRMRSRADNIRSAADGAIYSDDPDAIEALEARIADLEAQRETFKAHNKAMRKPDACDHPGDCDCRTRFPRECSCKNHVLPAYVLQNLGGNINRQKKRLEQLQRERDRGTRAVAKSGRRGYYVKCVGPDSCDLGFMEGLTYDGAIALRDAHNLEHHNHGTETV